MKVALRGCKTPHTVPRKLDVAKQNTSEYQQILAQAMDEAFGTNSSTVMTLRKCGTTLNQSHTLQLPMYWVIQSTKIQTGPKNMMKISSDCLLRNRRLTCNTWHVNHNITKWLFSLSSQGPKEDLKYER